MTTPRPLLPIFVAVLFGGIAHAGDFSLGGSHLLAQNTVQASDVAVTFTERGRSMRETSEGGDSTARNARALRGTDDVTPASTDSTTANPPAAKAPDAAPAATDSPHGGVSISPAAALRRPSYRWQSLVPGTIK